MINNQEMSIILYGRIVKYYPLTQLADIQISVETVYSSAEVLSEVKTREPLEGVPVHTPSGGGWSITMPIKKGDTCLLFFSQVGYDHWLYEDKDTAGQLANSPKPWVKRQFDEDDGFALVGLNTLPRAIKNYSATDSEWRNEDATQAIRLKEDLSIVIDSPTELILNAPKVTVNAPETIIQCETASITATTSTLIDSPDTTVTGNLTVGGLITGAGGLAVSGGSGASIDGDITSTGAFSASGEVSSGGNTLTQHTHTEINNAGNPVQTSTANG